MAGSKHRWVASLCLIVLCGGMTSGSFADETLDKLLKSQKYTEAVAYADDKLPQTTNYPR